MAENICKCPICGQMKKPTWDHIPPKCCSNNERVFFFPYTTEYLTKALGYMPKNKNYQDGLKFKYACTSCNSSMGSKYDLEIKKICDYFIEKMQCRSSYFSGSVNGVILGVISHMLASSSYADYKDDKDARNLVNNPTKYMSQFANKYSLFVSYYPYTNNKIVARDFYVEGKTNYFPGKLMSILYFYPVAFILCNKQENCKMTDLFEILLGNESDIICRNDQWTEENGRMLSPLYPLDLSDGVVITTRRHNNNMVIASTNRDDPFMHYDESLGEEMPC